MAASHEDAHDRDQRDTGVLVPLLIGIGATAAAGALFALARRSGDRDEGPLFSDAPLATARDGRSGRYRQGSLVERTVTIARPRQELYDYWRDFQKLPRFMENLHGVERIDDTRSRWTIAAPAGREVEFVSRIVSDDPGRLIAWKSEPGGDIDNSGRVEFVDAPAGRGTMVRLEIAYDPPAGALGRTIAKLFAREPAIQAKRDLRRFKQLMETGEIATAEPGPAAPRAA